MADPIPTLGRRVVIKVGGAGLAAAALPLACGNTEFPFVPPDGSLDPDTGTGLPPEDGGGGTDAASGDTYVNYGDTGACMVNENTLVLPLSAHPELSSTGGSTALTDPRYSDPLCQGNTLYVITTGPGQYAAFSSSCTHTCCEITVAGGTATCPCHGATYNAATGAVTKGPAIKPLPSIPICTDGTDLFIQLK